MVNKLTYSFSWGSFICSFIHQLFQKTACLPSVCSLAALLSIVQVFTTPSIRPCVVWWFSRACPFKSKALDCLLLHYCTFSHPTSKPDPTYTRNPSVLRRREKRGIISPAADTPLHPLQRRSKAERKEKGHQKRSACRPCKCKKQELRRKKGKRGQRRR